MAVSAPLLETASIRVPRASPDGAGVTLEVSLPLPPDDAGPRGLDAVRLALAAVDAEAAENFDRLLALDGARGVDHYPHQVETVLRVLKRFFGRVLLADEVGLGKTIEAGLVLAEYVARGLVRRALVLCPPALVHQWRAELEEKLGLVARTTLDAGFRADPDAFVAAEGVVIASLAAARSKAHRARFEAQRFDLVIVDEAHHLKNRATRGWELVNGLRSRFLLLLTATPIETDLGELYNLITLLRPGTLGTEADFRRRFGDPKDPLVPRRAHELRELLREVMIRNTRATAGVGLPPRTARTIVVEPSAGERALMDELLRLTREAGPGRHATLLRTLLEQAGSSARAVARTAAQAAAPTPELARRLKDVAARAAAVEGSRKVDWLLELVPGGKLLVFTRFLASHDELLEALERRGVPCVSFTGALPAAKRAEAVARFRDEAAVMVCSEVGGEGQNLQFCHRVVNYDLPWNPMLIEQRVGRVHRIGQTEAVEVVNLCLGGSPEERILDVLDRRLNLFELVVGELDLLLGDLEDERDFGDQVFDIYATARDEAEVLAGFEALGERLAGARGDLERVKGAAAAAFGDALGAT